MYDSLTPWIPGPSSPTELEKNLILIATCYPGPTWDRLGLLLHFLIDPCYRFYLLRISLFTNQFVKEETGMEMKMSSEEARKRALELMYQGYH